MSDCQRVFLGTIANVQTGPFGSQLHAADYVTAGVPIVTVEHLGDNCLIHDNLPLVGAADYARLHRYRLQMGDVVFSRVGAVDRRAFVSKREDGWLFSGRLLRVRPDANLAHSRYLSWLLGFEAVQRWIANHAVGSTMPCLNTTILASVPLELPPLPEQRRAAEVLDTADEAIRQTEALIAKLKQMKQGLLHDLLTRGLDEKGELRDPVVRPEEFKDSPLGRVPQAWEVVRVSSAGEVKLGRQRSPEHERGRSMTPYLRVANVFDGWIDYSDVLEMNFTPAERETYGVHPGDILLNEGQSLELVGRCAIYNGPANQFCFQNTLVRFRPNKTTGSAFVRAVFKQFLDTGRFMAIAKQTTSIAHLGADRFARMFMPRPSVQEQHRIVTVLQAHDARIRKEEAYISKLRLLKQGLMQDLLTGRVRVPVLERDFELIEVGA